MVKKTSTRKSPAKKGTKKTATKKSQNKKIQEIISQHPGPVIVSPEVSKSQDVVFVPPTSSSFAKVVPVAPTMSYSAPTMSYSSPRAPAFNPSYVPPPPSMGGPIAPVQESALQKALRERLAKSTGAAKFGVGFGAGVTCPKYEVWDPTTKSCKLVLKQNVYDNTPLKR